MSEKPTILILGTDHFSNHDNGDMFMTQTDGIYTEKRQGEMSEVLECLKNFRPTKVALEILKEDSAKQNRDYDSYLKNGFSLSTNETHQIGFRLAKRCGLDRVYAVDWNGSLEGDLDFEKSAKQNNQVHIYNKFVKTGKEMNAQAQEYFQNHSLRKYLLWLNEKKNIDKNHQLYMNLALIGSDSNPIGAMWTTKYWYYRNMLIYKNLVSLINSKEDRIFVLYGAGHLYLLLHFLKESGLFNVELAGDYL